MEDNTLAESSFSATINAPGAGPGQEQLRVRPTAFTGIRTRCA